MEELDIDREFAELCPALTPEEYAQLEQGILDDGCLHPIILWRGVILDGHNRYEICRKHERPFKTKTLNLPDRDAALAWIIRNQLGRRNLSESQRAMLAGKLTKTKASDGSGANLPLATAAEEFNVSERSVKSARKVLDAGAKQLQKAVESDEVAVSTAAVVATLPKAEQRKVVAKGPAAVKAKAKEITEAGKVKQYNDTFDPADMKKPKNGSEKKTQFKDSKIDDLFGSLLRAVDDRWNLVGTHGNGYRALIAKLKESVSLWGEWRKAK